MPTFDFQEPDITTTNTTCAENEPFMIKITPLTVLLQSISECLQDVKVYLLLCTVLIIITLTQVPVTLLPYVTKQLYPQSSNNSNKHTEL